MVSLVVNSAKFHGGFPPIAEVEAENCRQRARTSAMGGKLTFAWCRMISGSAGCSPAML
jgi:hypothetical protein